MCQHGQYGERDGVRTLAVRISYLSKDRMLFTFLFVSGSETGLGGHCSSLVARFFVCLFFALLVSLLLRGGTGYYLASHLVASSSG